MTLQTLVILLRQSVVFSIGRVFVSKWETQRVLASIAAFIWATGQKALCCSISLTSETKCMVALLRFSASAWLLHRTWGHSIGHLIVDFILNV